MPAETSVPSFTGAFGWTHPGGDGHALSLLTDLYQLTMASGYWTSGRADREAVFHMFFRACPFGGGYAVACGLASFVEYVERFRVQSDDLEYLTTLRDMRGEPLFPSDFLDAFGALELTCDIDAAPEGSVVFPHEPVLRVRGPIMQCQLLETALLNFVNFQTLIATKAARIVSAAGDDDVLEFGLRRAHGIDGGVTASRAAYVGGCAASSNVLAGKLYGIPIRGTHAHSWVMSFDDEEESFRVYAEAMPNNCVFLVDTYDSIEGVRTAIRVGRDMRARGADLAGIRLDSGDLAYLSIEARALLDEAGFPNAKIVASNDLDETIIQSLKSQGAKIDVWGVGTRLATAYDQPALGGVYKLGALRDRDGNWRDRIKVSEQAIKNTTPGILQVMRHADRETLRADVVVDENALPANGRPLTMVDPFDHTRQRTLDEAFEVEPLLKPIFRGGRCVYDVPSATEARAHAATQLKRLHPGIRRFENPHAFPVGLEQGLHERRTALILEARERGRKQ